MLPRKKTNGNPCKFQIKFLSLQRQSVLIGYPGRIPRGSKTSPTLLHFKSHLRVTFLFVIESAKGSDEMFVLYCTVGNGQHLGTFEYQYFYRSGIPFKVFVDTTS